MVFRWLTYIAVLCVLVALASCYVRPAHMYVGRDTLPETTRRTMRGELRRIPRVFEIKTLPPPDLTPRPEITAALRRYTVKDRRYIPLAYEKRAEYLPVLRQIFKDEGVPVELLNLALVESGFRTTANSHRGAVGMWQFMKPTARSYGLKISLLEDQRKDPILSTIAAARMLRDLYDAYEDWPLALAAYNTGPARVDRALIKTGAHDYWGLCEQNALSRETRDFVPRILAATMIEKDPELYGFMIPGEHL